MSPIARSLTPIARCTAALALLCAPASAQLTPEWISALPVGTSLSSGLGGYVLDAAGNTYLTGTTGSGPFGLDVVIAAYGPDGTLLWQTTYDGPLNGFDQGSAIAWGPGGVLYVAGDTQGPDFFARVLLLKVDAATGAVLDSAVYSGGPNKSEYGGSVAVDALGGVYVAGGTSGDGTDALILKFDAACDLQWTRIWDGAAFEPYTLDNARTVHVDPNGDVVVLVHGVTGSNQPDFVVMKLDPDTGAPIWTASWGDNGGDTPRELQMDAAGDVYVAGVSGFFEDARFSTVKFHGTDGALLWQSSFFVPFRNRVYAMSLDGAGGVYVAGTVDPDENLSNDNDNVFAFKLGGATGALLWTHVYGGNAKFQRDEPSDIVVDPKGHVFVGGWTNSPPYVSDVITLILDATTGGETGRHLIDGGTNLFAESGQMALDADFNLRNVAGPVNSPSGASVINVMKFTTLASRPYQLGLPLLSGGAGATFAVKNATPNAQQFLVLGLDGTATIPIPAIGATLGLANPQLLLAGPANANGAMSFGLFVPASASGTTVWFQGLQMNGATPVLKRTVQ